MERDTIPSQLFTEETTPRRRPPTRKIGGLGVVVIAALLALGGLALTKLIQRLVRPAKK